MLGERVALEREPSLALRNVHEKKTLCQKTAFRKILPRPRLSSSAVQRLVVNIYVRSAVDEECFSQAETYGTLSKVSPKGNVVFGILRRLTAIC